MVAELKNWRIQKLPRDLSLHEAKAIRDIAHLWEISTQPFWTFNEIMTTWERPEIVGYVAEAALTAPDSDLRWDAFLLAEQGIYQTELLYIYVRPECRQSGLGQEIFHYFLGELKKAPSQEALFLEVRRSNESAQRLYRKMGMEQVGTRRAYYQNGEDAFVFKKDIK